MNSHHTSFDWRRGRRLRPAGVSLLLPLVLLGGGSGAGCSGPASAGRLEVPQIGLVRGARGSSLALTPPYLSGPQFGLVLEDGVLFGWVGGEAARAGALRVTIEEDGASGFGPLGPVAMDFVGNEAEIAADGQWNGRRVHLVFGPQAVHGTVADNVALAPDQLSGGPSPLDPVAADSSCEYVLDRLTADGAFEGTSICAGMPQQTRLFVSPKAAALLRTGDMVTVLVAVLSAPPLPASEVSGPRFDFPE